MPRSTTVAFGTHQVIKTVRQLLRYAQSQPDVEPRLRRIPEVVVRHTTGLRTRYVVAPAPEDFDYVFAIADLAALTGAEYEEKRRAIRRLQDESAVEVRRIDVRDAGAQRLMTDIFDRWAVAKGVAQLPETVMEQQAMRRLFALAEATGDDVIGLVVLDEGVCRWGSARRRCSTTATRSGASRRPIRRGRGSAP
jgi:hypothetical protein